MYTVVLTVSLWKDEERQQHGKAFFRSIELPFAPFVGLSIETSQFSSRRVTHVIWRDDEKYFLCGVEDRAAIRSGESGTTYEDLFEFLESEEGWTPANKWKRGA